MTASCPLCHGSTARILATKLRRGVGTVFHCAGCDLGFLVGGVNHDRYASAYREEVSHRAGVGATTPQEVFEAYRLYQGDRLRLVEPYLRKDASVLEIGAGAGQFIHHLENRVGRMCAIEPDTKSCDFMNRLGVETSSHLLLESRFAKEKFDLVCAFQVIEHVGDPVGFLRGVKDVLKPGGHAVIEVPNLHDPLRSVWGNEAYEQFFFHADHRFYFSSRSFGIAKALAGFAPENAELHFLQDYNLANHLFWIWTQRPQSTCHEGFGAINFGLGDDDPTVKWLSDELNFINLQYMEKIKLRGLTSNLAVVLRA